MLFMSSDGLKSFVPIFLRVQRYSLIIKRCVLNEPFCVIIAYFFASCVTLQLQTTNVCQERDANSLL